jgi:threonyl-tRNA synthetase
MPKQQANLVCAKATQNVSMVLILIQVLDYWVSRELNQYIMSSMNCPGHIHALETKKKSWNV